MSAAKQLPLRLAAKLADRLCNELWHCGDCGAEWLEDDDDREGDA